MFRGVDAFLFDLLNLGRGREGEGYESGRLAFKLTLLRFTDYQLTAHDGDFRHG